MKIFPAIDLYGGKAVRLYKGDYAQMTVYSDDPVSVARDFERQGAKYIHVVDLEGAKIGKPAHLDVVERIAKETDLFIEIGGGIRDMETVGKYLSVGVNRVILGTAAVTDETFLRAALAAHGEKIAVGADIADGRIAIRGWLEKSEYTTETFFDKMQSLGVKTVICTDISKDGAMKGTNRALYKELGEKYTIDIVASGGVSTLDDVAALAAAGTYGAIIGKAYYIGAIDLEKAIQVAK
ncbi:MAG: 1-(5-phosphoribosyl)-5-[Clostridia bacterium]|nr:1-(5-phosphoribosyl)-5-[(5-phosphoribosylamino)methylideneamino]imidazole-4-carboxamide isomerase [Clostridia bacterium]MBQ8446331.1 1-(5-phosphoribosyl)-5-[(5-phosphoribosylamino)methylideneamino]imidazole-4-carboxamide isomerase [Clostridia bacterium]